jgi:hypothetical protein
VVAVSGDGGAGFLARLDEGRTGYMCSQTSACHCGMIWAGRELYTWNGDLLAIDCELHVGLPSGCRGEGAGGAGGGIATGEGGRTRD